MYECARCGFTTTEEGEASLHAFEEHGLEMEECFTEEETTIDDTPESVEKIKESENVSEEELRGQIILEHYGEIKDETLKKEILSIAMGQSVGSNKKISGKVTTKNAFRKAYEKVFKGILDKSSFVCPICNRDLSLNMKEDLSTVDARFVKVKHLRDAHAYVYQVFKEIFEVPVSERDYDDKEISKPKHMRRPLVVGHGQTIPTQAESLTEEQLETLSKEELYEKAVKDENFRKNLFRKWKKTRETN